MGYMRTPPLAAIESVNVAAYTLPTDFPEADGTYAWKATTLVVVEVAAGGQQGVEIGRAHV